MSRLFLLSLAKFLYLSVVLEGFSIVNQYKTAFELKKSYGDKNDSFCFLSTIFLFLLPSQDGCIL